MYYYRILKIIKQKHAKITRNSFYSNHVKEYIQGMPKILKQKYQGKQF